MGRKEGHPPTTRIRQATGLCGPARPRLETWLLHVREQFAWRGHAGEHAPGENGVAQQPELRLWRVQLL